MKQTSFLGIALLLLVGWADPALSWKSKGKGCPVPLAGLVAKNAAAPALGPAPSFAKPLAVESIMARGSLADRYPDLFADVRQILRALDVREEVKRRPDLTMDQAVRYVFEARVSEATRLRDLANYWQLTDPELAGWLRRAANRILPTEKERDSAADLLERTELETGLRLGNVPVRLNLDYPSNILRDLTSRARGDTGELLAALLLEEPTGIGVHVRDLPRVDDYLRRARPRIPRELQDFYLQKEIDVIFKRGRAWGEVKNTSYVTLDKLTRNPNEIYGRGAPRPGAKVKKSMLEQAEENARLARAFGKEPHAIFIHGIAPDAAAELRKLGIKVHNVLSQPPND